MYDPKIESEKVYNYLNQIDFKLKELENFIKVELSHIGEYTRFEDAYEKFALLNDILLYFGKAIFNSNYTISGFLLTFFQDFDRLDDISVQKKLFEAIRNNALF